MIVTDNHFDFYSLRGVPPPRGRLWLEIYSYTCVLTVGGFFDRLKNPPFREGFYHLLAAAAVMVAAAAVIGSVSAAAAVAQ
jgi:hypothetical protein